MISGVYQYSSQVGSDPSPPLFSLPLPSPPLRPPPPIPLPSTPPPDNVFPLRIHGDMLRVQHTRRVHVIQKRMLFLQDGDSRVSFPAPPLHRNRRFLLSHIPPLPPSNRSHHPNNGLCYDVAGNTNEARSRTGDEGWGREKARQEGRQWAGEVRVRGGRKENVCGREDACGWIGR